VASPQSTRSVREIRDYLIERLNGALLRPGMYGNELTTLMHLGDLAWIERRDADLGSVAETLAQAGAWSSTAVRGAFQLIFGGIPTDHDSAAALVYAGIAQAWGYLVPQRGLPAGEYARLRRDARAWTASTGSPAPRPAPPCSLPAIRRRASKLDM
jgi:hypothetical protein